MQRMMGGQPTEGNEAEEPEEEETGGVNAEA